MRPVRVLARSAVSALGVGARLHCAAPLGEPAHSRVQSDEQLAKLGLTRPRVARVPDLVVERGVDPGLGFLLSAGRELLDQLHREQPNLHELSLGVAIGTSTGSMSSMIECFRALEEQEPLSRELARRSCLHAPFAAFVETLPKRPRRQAHLLAACASSTMAIGLGCRWLELGEVDLAICGGYDALNLLVCAGFESLGATTRATPAPFRVGRDGMALGEGAALLALALEDRAAPGSACVLGFAATSDAYHVTAPEPEGLALARAVNLALEDAGVGPEAVGLVSAHGTATHFNDLAEARALSAVFGEGRTPVVDVPKAVLGHTLGASGALEAVLTLDYLEQGVVPAVSGRGEMVPELRARLPRKTESAAVGSALKLSAGFGGSNAVLVLGSPTPGREQRPRRQVCVERSGGFVKELAWGRLAEHARVDTSKLRHADAATELALAAALEVAAKGPLAPDSAVLVASRTLGIAANRAFFERLHRRGVSGVAPRLFPNTSPNLCASQCSIAFGLTGPCLAVDEAPWGSQHGLDTALALLHSGQSEYLLFIVLEQADAATDRIFEAAAWPAAAHGARAVLLRSSPELEGSKRLDRVALAGRANLFELVADMGRLAESPDAAWE